MFVTVSCPECGKRWRYPGASPPPTTAASLCAWCRQYLPLRAADSARSPDTDDGGRLLATAPAPAAPAPPLPPPPRSAPTLTVPAPKQPLVRGRRRLLLKLGVIAVVVCLLLFAAAVVRKRARAALWPSVAPSAWVTFTPDDGACRLDFPGNPALMPPPAIKAANPRRYQLDLQREQLVLFLVHFDIPTKQLFALGGDPLDTVCRKAVAEVDGKGKARFVSERPVRLKDCDGREIRFEGPKGETLVARIYLVRGPIVTRTYVLGAGTIRGRGDRPEIPRFLDSLVLTGPPHSPRPPRPDALLAAAAPEEIGRWQPHETVRGLAWLSGDRLLTLSADPKPVATLWNAADLKTIRAIDLPAPPMAPVVSGVGRWLATPGPKGVQIIDLSEERQQVVVLVPSGRGAGLRVHCAAFSEHADVLGVGLGGERPGEGELQFFKVGSGEVRERIKIGADAVRAFAVSPGERTLVVGDGERIRSWETATHRETPPLLGHERSVVALAYGQEGAVLASADEGGVIRLWNGVNGEALRALPGHRAAVRRLAFFDDGQLLFSADDDGELFVWDVATGAMRKRLRVSAGAVRCLAFSADWEVLATAGVEGVRFWDVASILAGVV